LGRTKSYKELAFFSKGTKGERRADVFIVSDLSLVCQDQTGGQDAVCIEITYCSRKRRNTCNCCSWSGCDCVVTLLPLAFGNLGTRGRGGRGGRGGGRGRHGNDGHDDKEFIGGGTTEFEDFNRYCH